MGMASVDSKLKLLHDESATVLLPEPAKLRSKKNQEILIFTCSAFFLFAMAEVVGAVASNSLSLLGDGKNNRDHSHLIQCITFFK
jgi:Co/Zn/Cd efflux system component